MGGLQVGQSIQARAGCLRKRACKRNIVNALITTINQGFHRRTYILAHMALYVLSLLCVMELVSVHLIYTRVYMCA